MSLNEHVRVKPGQAGRAIIKIAVSSETIEHAKKMVNAASFFQHLHLNEQTCCKSGVLQRFDNVCPQTLAMVSSVVL